MERIELRTYLEQGLSLEQIGLIVGRHLSTVGYWVGRFGLEANGAARHTPKGAIDYGLLADLVSRGLKLREIATTVDRSISTVRYWLRKYELDAPRVARRFEITRAIEKGRRTLMRECATHGWTIFVIENSGRTRCRQCRMDRVSEWRRRTKAKLVAEAGGQCALCGYDVHQAALHFHHLDPKQKKFQLSNGGKTRSIDELRKEVAKCVLLCGNCHAEVEAGFTQL
ncbi:MAG: hypothetical protein M3383_02520 [Actinomycetota bacterium]|nr:hypothetical protein [Actinomycetota bacterium]